MPQTRPFLGLFVSEAPKKETETDFFLLFVSEKKIKERSERGKIERGKTISGKIGQSVSFRYGRPEIRIWKSVTKISLSDR